MGGNIATAKSNPNRPATEIYRDLALPLRLAGISARAGWTTRNSKHLTHHQHRTGRSEQLDVQMEKILARASKAAGDNAMANQTKRWQMPVKKGSKNTCGTIKRLVCRLRPEKS